MERKSLWHANLTHPAHDDGSRRRSRSAHVDGAALGDYASDRAADDWEVVMLVRPLLVAIVALLLSGCVNSERFREDFGPRDYDRAERIPSR
jgi:hypothetical protein